MIKKPQYGQKRTPETKRKALEALAKTGSRVEAAAAAGITLKTLEDWRKRDKEFGKEWNKVRNDIMTDIRQNPLDDQGNFRRSPLAYGMKSTPENKELVLRALSAGVSVAAAAALIGAHRGTVIGWKGADTDFKEKYEEALDEGTDLLEDEAVRRARDGVKRPVFYMGEICGYIQEYSDSLLKFMLEARRPAIFRSRSINLVPPEGDGDKVLEVRWKDPEQPEPEKEETS